MARTAAASNASKTHTPPDFKTGLSLRWKLFLSLFALLGLVLTAMGRLSWVNLNDWHQRYSTQQFNLNGITINALVDQKVSNLSLLASQLLASIELPAEPTDSSSSPDEFNISANFLASLNWIRMYDAEARLIAHWGLFSAQQSIAADLLEGMAKQSASELKPDAVVHCGEVCELLVVVPAFDLSGRTVIVILAVPFYDLIPDFYQATGVDVAYIADNATGQTELLAVSNAPKIRPLLQTGLANGLLNSPQWPIRIDEQARVHSLYETALNQLRVLGRPLRIILIRDDSAAVRSISLSSNTYLSALGIGMLMVSLAVFLLISGFLRRLTRITKLLPVLAEQRFDDARSQLAHEGRRIRSPDEVDALLEGLRWLNERLNELHGAEAASEAKSRFLATMSHEIRTPLSGILGLIEILEMSPLSSEQKRTAKMIHESASALMSIISDVLDYSKVEAGHADIENRLFQLDEMVEKSADSIAATAVKKGLRVVVAIDPALPLQVQGDALKSRQILLNLCSNALKFTESGRILVRAELKDHIGDMLWIRFSVSDTGVGIAEQAKERLFKRFSQADASTTRRYGGSGLGLAICKSLTELMGGRIGFDSIEGVGSKFWYELPYQMTASASEDTLPSLSGIKVAVLNDDLDELHAWQNYCEAAGAELTRGGDADTQPEHIAVSATLTPTFSGATLTHYDKQGQANASIQLARPIHRQELLTSISGLHATPAATSESSGRAADSENSPGIQLHARVLVVEDHRINLELVSQQLRLLGCQPVQASNGVEALRILEKQSVDLVLSDLHMPEMDGYSLIRRIRDHKSAAIRKLPVVVLTASAGTSDEQRLHLLRINDKLVKPASLKQLADCLQKHLPEASQAHQTPAPDLAGPDSQLDQPEALTQVVDLQVIRAVFGDDQTLLNQIAKDFIHTNDELLEQLINAIRARQSDQIQQLAHRFKGSASSFGAKTLLTDLQALESHPDGDDIEAQIAPLKAHYTALREYLLTLGEQHAN